jgi:alpha-beta hydrolase superfamily lysophospholipase
MNAGGKAAAYFGAPSRPLFGFYHPPGDGPWRDTAVVLCNPIGTDMTRSDRTYRHLGERLAAAGFACLRFDLFGTGDSGGDEFASGLVSGWLDDIGAAIDQVRARSGAKAIALVGLRLGATLACLHSCARDDVDSLVLWSPNVTGAGFLAEVTKLHKLYLRMEPHLLTAPAPRTPGIEALGCFLPQAMAADIEKLDLRELARRPARRTLVIDGGNVADRDALVGRLRETGASPEVRNHPGHKFLVTVSHRSLVPTDVLDSIVGWLSEAHPGAARRPPTTTPPAPTPAPFAERPFTAGNGQPLFGILTPAAAGKGRPNRPTIVMANAGCVNRHGPHRIYVKMARRWAGLGFDVLRMDLSGIGDSPVAPGVQENLTYPPSGLEDIRRAMRELGTGGGGAAPGHGSGRFIIAGLCSGGDYAFQLGANDPGVVGAWLLNPRTFCVLALAAVESGSPPATPVDEVPRTLRSMADKGVETTVVVSRNDPGVTYVDSHAKEGMRSLEGRPHYRRVDLEGSDHSFTPVTMQDRVSDILTEELGRY